MTEEVPKDLTELEYARHILEYTLGWPATKSNLELVSGAITAITKFYRKPGHVAFKNLNERIEAARGQAIEINGHFFRDGEYMNVKRKQPDTWKQREEREAQFAAHGCDSGWVYVEGGVKRCVKCISGAK